MPYSGGGSAHTHAASRRVDTIILPLKTYILTIVAELTISDNLKRSVGYYLWSHVGHLLSHHWFSIEEKRVLTVVAVAINLRIPCPGQRQY